MATAESQPGDHRLQWFCTQALLLNGKVEEGLRHLAGYDPDRAFDLYCVRHQYREALRLYGAEDGQPLDRAWIESLPAQGDSDGRRAVARVDSAAKVIRLLHALGREAEAVAALGALEEYARSQHDAAGPDSPRRQCFERLCETWIALGQPHRAWQLVAETAGDGGPFPPVLTRVFSAHSSDARLLWNLLRQVHPEDSIAQTCGRLYAVMNPAADEDLESIAQMFQRAAAWLESPDASGSDAMRAAVARAWLDRNLLDAAESVLKDADAERSEILALLAALSDRRQRWDEAAERYQRLWQTDRNRLADLFASGEALRKAGRTAEADQRQQLLHRLAIDSRARYQLVRDLVDRGWRKQAVEHCHILVRTSPPDHPQWHGATRLLAEHLTVPDPGGAAEWFEFSLLDDLRTYFHLVQLSAYVRIPALIDRLRAAAAVDAGDFEAAMRHARAALQAMPGDIKIAEELAPRLAVAGQREAAEHLFNEQLRLHQQWCADWPDSDMLKRQLERLLAAKDP
jgi:tetratricopeptide (TPR) repeat protein